MSMGTASEQDDGTERCPQCGSAKVAGLVAAFFVPVNGLQDYDWRGASEIGPERICLVCNEEWDADEQGG
jgi:hypothetical protein